MDPKAGTSAVVPPDSGMLGSEEPFADPGGDDHRSGYLPRLGSAQAPVDGSHRETREAGECNAYVPGTPTGVILCLYDDESPQQV